MTDDALENFIRQYIEQQNTKEIVFSWQGGEPCLRGLDFFKKVIALEKKYAPSYVRCENDLQTNGTLLNDEWCAFLRENNFLVGLSIDGPRNLHNRYRTGKNGEGSFDDVFRAVRLLHRHQVRFATLTVVNDYNANYPLEVYRFLRDEAGSKQMQFIPLVEPKNYRTTAPQRWHLSELPTETTTQARPESFVADWSVDPLQYGEFLIKIFDEWYKHDLGRIYVPFFDSAVEQWMGKPSPLCIFSPICGKGLAMEHDGSIYVCDHYVYPEYRIGNIHDSKLIDMALSNEQEWFGYAKDRTLPQKCRLCPYLFACSGECPKNRFLKTAQGEPGLNYLCQGLFNYFQHIDPYIRKIVKKLRLDD